MKKNIRILSILTVFITVLFSGVITYAAEPSYMFNSNYYSIRYDDLNNAFGTNYSKLKNHWNKYGKKEGRSPSPIYDPDYYLKNNGDLKNAFGDNYVALYNHFINYGINEFRKSSPIYDGTYYKTHYSDLQVAFGNNSKLYLEHFLKYGMKEGRQASADFNVHDYKDRYGDLQIAFGNDLSQYYLHYMQYGINEGRNGSSTGKYSPAQVPDITNTIQKQNSSKSNSAQQAGNGLIGNLSKVRLIKQGSKTCKATAVAQSVNIIMGKNTYSTSSFGNANCKNINGNTYVGSDGNRYKATYKTDSYRGSASEQMSKINNALSNGLPIIVSVHKVNSGTKHHWVTIIGKTGNTYEIIDPATGTKRTMSNAGYDFGLTNSGKSGLFYGYVYFSKQ